MSFARLTDEDNPENLEQEWETEELELVAAGVLRLPTAPLPPDFWENAPLGIAPEIIQRVISEERDEAEDRCLRWMSGYVDA